MIHESSDAAGYALLGLLIEGVSDQLELRSTHRGPLIPLGGATSSLAENPDVTVRPEAYNEGAFWVCAGGGPAVLVRGRADEHFPG